MKEKIRPGIPVKVFYHEVRQGDIEKYKKVSNISNTGGGARDLRLSPKEFWEEMADFFPTVISTRKRSGIIYSAIGDCTFSENIEFMAPTEARKNEVRICVIAKVKGWELNQEDYENKINAGYKWFYLLVLDDNNKVWATKFSTDVIDKMHDSIEITIKSKLATISKNSIRGIIKC